MNKQKDLKEWQDFNWGQSVTMTSTVYLIANNLQ